MQYVARPVRSTVSTGGAMMRLTATWTCIYLTYFHIIFMKQITCRLQHDYNTITAYLMHIYIILHYIYKIITKYLQHVIICISYVIRLLSACSHHVHIMFTICSQHDIQCHPIQCHPR